VTALDDFGGVFGTAFGHYLLGSHNFMVTALGSGVKWPSDRSKAFLTHSTLSLWQTATFIILVLTQAYELANFKDCQKTCQNSTLPFERGRPLSLGDLISLTPHYLAYHRMGLKSVTFSGLANFS
jgi:hypothetical protein